MNVKYSNSGLSFFDHRWMLRVWATGAARVQAVDGQPGLPEGAGSQIGTLLGDL